MRQSNGRGHAGGSPDLSASRRKATYPAPGRDTFAARGETITGAPSVNTFRVKSIAGAELTDMRSHSFRRKRSFE
jgi:hypothetical protein